MKLDWKSIQLAMHQLIEEYKFPPHQVFEILKMWIKSAFRKDYFSWDKKVVFHVKIDKDWKIQIFREYQVVEKIEEEDREILLEDAKKYRKDVKIDEAIFVDITPETLEFSRIAVQAAAQTIKQNLKKIERERFFDKFQDKQWELLKWKVLKIIGDNIVLDIDGTTVILAPEWQIPNRVYTIWEQIFVLLKQISKWTGWIVLDITQSTVDFIEVILRKMVPELDEWKVIIKKIVRSAWKRTKLLVSSDDERIDPVWVFIWQHGTRISNILTLLDWEKIDFIEFSNDDEQLVKDSLKPARVDKVELSWKKATVYLQQDQKALAIWKWAVNIKLASQLSWYKIEVN